MTMSTWVEALDAFEARLERQLTFLDAVDAGATPAATPPDAWAPPPDLGGLPNALRPRARDLLAVANGLLARSRATADRLRPRTPQPQPRPLSSAVAPAPYRLDLSA